MVKNSVPCGDQKKRLTRSSFQMMGIIFSGLTTLKKVQEKVSKRLFLMVQISQCLSLASSHVVSLHAGVSATA